MDDIDSSDGAAAARAGEIGSIGVSTPWKPIQLVFKRYLPQNGSASKVHVAVKKPVVVRLTRDLVETYKICDPQFKYRGELNPKRSDSRQRYIVKDLLGHGTFGQVAKCWVPETNSFVAVKVIKNQLAYYQQALVEVSILTTLNKKYDPEDKNHIVRIYDYFLHQSHLCICFELLDMNLYELIKINQFRGLSLSIVKLFSKQMLSKIILKSYLEA